MSSPRRTFVLPLRLALLAGVTGVLAGPLPASPQGTPRPGAPPKNVSIGTPAKAASKRHPKRTHRFAPNVVVVTYKAGDVVSRRRQLESRFGLTVDPKTPSRYFVRYFIRSGVSVEAVAAALSREPNVRSAEPDYAITPDQVPNDPNFGDLWGLHNTGQNSGTADADIDAPEAWAMVPNNAPEVRVAVLDDGVQITHPDLAANIWTNPGEIAGNGIDDDGNGYVDDVQGWDTADNDNNPMPATVDDSHGTHVAGTVAGVTNNGIGVAGVGKRIKIVPIRMYKGQSTWMTSLANGVDYARIAGAKVLNVSYNTDDYTTFLMDAIVRAQNADIVYVGSSGNNGENMDALRGRMKQGANNIMFVAATDRNDQIASFSNYGQTTDIAAPGVAILSTVPNNSYAVFDGTSMATPHVAGAAGVLRVVYPNLTYAQVIARLNGSADFRNTSLLGRIKGGRLNLANALETDTVAPSAPGALSLVARTSARLRLRTTTAGDDGAAGKASRYEVRVSDSAITTANYASARVAGILPEFPAGQPLTFEVPGLIPGKTSYFAIRAFDNVGNPSGIVSSGPMTTANLAWKDNLEGASQWTGQTGKTWTLTSGNAQSGLKAWEDSPNANYANNEYSFLTLGSAVSVTGPTVFRFLGKIDLEANYDYLYVDASMDGGATWMTISQVTGSDPVWRAYSAVLPGTGTRSVRLRFRLVTDETFTYSGVTLDDFSLVPMATLLTENMESGTSNWSYQAPWQLAMDKALSPSNSWSDSPFSGYLDNTQARLDLLTSTDVRGVADPVFSFALNYGLEYGYDYLDVYSVYDGADYLATWFTGSSLGEWTMQTIPLASTASFRPAFVFFSDETGTDEGVNLDDFGIYGEPWQTAQTVNVSMGLDGFTGAAGSRVATVDIYSGTTLLESHTMTLPAGGQNVALNTFTSGATTFVVRADGWLRKRQNVTVANGVNVAVTLVNGDADRDNVITSSDFVLVNNCFGKAVGQTGYDARADLNGDNKVDSADLAIVMRNQRKRGD